MKGQPEARLPYIQIHGFPAGEACDMAAAALRTRPRLSMCLDCQKPISARGPGGARKRCETCAPESIKMRMRDYMRVRRQQDKETKRA